MQIEPDNLLLLIELDMPNSDVLVLMGILNGCLPIPASVAQLLCHLNTVYRSAWAELIMEEVENYGLSYLPALIKG